MDPVKHSWKGRFDFISLKAKHSNELNKLQSKIDDLQSKLNGLEKQLAHSVDKQKDSVWDKVEISYTERPIHQAMIDSQKSANLVLLAIQDLKNIIDNNHSVRKEQIQHQLTVLEEKVKTLSSQQSVSTNNASQELDRLASMVNKLETHYRQQLPEHLRSISLTTNMTWASPTLLCLKLKEEYLQIEQDYNTLRSQLSAESNTYLSDNNALKDQVRSLGIQLSDVSTKYHREKEEKERIMHSLMGKDKEAFDSVRFHAVIEQNDALKKEIEDLKYRLIKEKHLKINQLFDDQEATTRLTSLNTELNTLMNIKVELKNQIQTINSAHEIHLAEKDREISHWKQENLLMGEKLVDWILQECFEQISKYSESLYARFGK